MCWRWRSWRANGVGLGGEGSEEWVSDMEAAFQGGVFSEGLVKLEAVASHASATFRWWIR